MAVTFGNYWKCSKISLTFEQLQLSWGGAPVSELYNNLTLWDVKRPLRTEKISGNDMCHLCLWVLGLQIEVPLSQQSCAALAAPGGPKHLTVCSWAKRETPFYFFKRIMCCPSAWMVQSTDLPSGVLRLQILITIPLDPPSKAAMDVCKQSMIIIMSNGDCILCSRSKKSCAVTLEGSEY